MLGSNHPGEIVGAAAALVRVLQSDDCDLHDLAAAIERGTSCDPGAAYRAGFQAGQRAERCECPAPSWRDMAERIDELDPRHHDFVLAMGRRTCEATERQRSYLDGLFTDLGGHQ